MANETKIQKAIQGYIQSLGGYEFKVHGDIFMRSGIPDIICCLKGRFVGIEAKDIGNEPSELQLAHGRKIEKAGGIFIVAYNVGDVERRLKEEKLI